MDKFMNVIAEAHVPMPMWEVSLLLIGLSACLVLRFNKMGLLAAYLFTFHMGWVALDGELLKQMPSLRPYAWVYFASGVVVLLLALIGMSKPRTNPN